MAGQPCGCGGEQREFVDGLGTRVTGANNRRQAVAWHLDPGTGQAPGCRVIMQCVGSHTGRGLSYDDGTAHQSIKLSNRADNLTTLDADRAVYTPGGELAVAVADVSADTPMHAEVRAGSDPRTVTIAYPGDLPEPHTRSVRVTGPCQYEEQLTAEPGSALSWAAPDCDGRYTVTDETSGTAASFVVPSTESAGTVLGRLRVGWWLVLTNRGVSRAGVDYVLDDPEPDDPEPASGTVPPGESVRWRLGETSAVTVSLTTSDAAGQDVRVQSGDATRTVRLLAQGALVAACARRVDALPSWVIGGQDGAGDNQAPWGTRRTYRRAVDRRLHATIARLQQLADDTIVIPPYPHALDHDWTYDPDPAELTGVNYSDISASAYASLGLSVGQTVGASDDPYYGLNEENQVGGTTLAEVLDEVGGRIVLLLDCSWLSSRGVDDVVDLVTQRCLGASVVLYGSDLGVLAPAADAGLPLGATVDADTLGSNTPQACLDAGCTWVIATVAPSQAEDRITWPDTTDYVAAGLHVLARGVITRYDTDIARGFGHRGILSPDPQYCANDFNWLPRVERDTWWASGMMSGQIAWRSATVGDHRYSYGHTRGHRQPHDGQSGWQIPTAGSYPRSTMLLGWCSPLQDPESYNVIWDVLYESTPNADLQYVALVIASLDDRPALLVQGDNDNDYANYLCGYALKFHWNGRMQLDRIDNGTFTELGAYGAPEPGLDNWWKFRAEVTPNDLTFYQAANTERRINVIDDTYRGHYHHALKYQASGAYDALIGAKSQSYG